MSELSKDSYVPAKFNEIQDKDVNFQMSPVSIKSSNRIDSDDVDLEYITNTTKDRHSNIILLGSFASIASLTVLWAHIGIRQLDFNSNSMLYLIGTIASVFSLMYSFRTMKHFLKFRIAQKNKISFDIEVLPSEDKKASKKQAKNLEMKIFAVDTEASFLTIFIYNTMFISVCVLCTFLLFSRMRPILNYILTVTMGCLTIMIHSKAKKSQYCNE
ncbi:hypothetical protein GJ496_005236 [Pomphorhynchus laevis]|nr:hypothetical protein GJ496_005236 [Pomphorhynchus laevis]